ncbi:MAG: hypothetical protein ACP5H2_04725 [Solirubrobacteraceae bacterium]
MSAASMGKRGRRRMDGTLPSGERSSRGRLHAPLSTYTDADGGELRLRGSLTPRARTEYSHTLAGGGDREDAWQRATELLFERLAVSWTVAGVSADRPQELLARYRMASAQERRFIRDSLRQHLIDNFPELEAP